MLAAASLPPTTATRGSIPHSPYDAQFGSVANWTTSAEQPINSGVGTVLTNFSDGATLAQWLQEFRRNRGGHIEPDRHQHAAHRCGHRHRADAILGDAEQRRYSGQTGNPVMQMTFNTPVGAPAANQCGRVMFNDYHVINVSASGKIYPTECPSYNNPSYTMSAQEEMLEYALFDLSTFVQPVVVPTLNITFNPSPLVVKSGDTGDQLTVSVTNTSTTTQIDSSAILTFTLPPQMTVTAMTDSTGGWICTASTATCTRNSSLAASATDSVTLTLERGDLHDFGELYGHLTATVSSVTFSTNPSSRIT